jgi:hypothetical protein
MMGADIFPQTTVDQFPAAAFAGQLFDPGQADIMSALVSESAGVEAGVAVILDTAQTSLLPGYGLKVKYPVDANSVVFGFTVLNVMKQPASPRFALKDSVALVRKGRIWCLVQNTVAQGDDVYAWYSTGSTKGSIRNDAGSTQAVKVRGAKVLIGASTAGFALVDCNFPLASADASVLTGGSWNVTAVKTSAYTAVIGDLVLVDPTGGAFTVTLPTAVGVVGQSIRVFNNTASTTAVTVATTSSQTINGSSTASMTTAHAGKEFTSDGANWVMVEA